MSLGLSSFSIQRIMTKFMSVVIAHRDYAGKQQNCFSAFRFVQYLLCVISLHRYFDEETFEHVSAEAKDFISNLLIKERRWGMDTFRRFIWIRTWEVGARKCVISELHLVELFFYKLEGKKSTWMSNLLSLQVFYLLCLSTKSSWTNNELAS